MAHGPDRSLEPFVTAHAEAFDRALAEMRSGRKATHWMWFVFPQIEGLGRSALARRYAIRDVAEAEAFLAHPVLGANYRTIVEAVAEQVVDRGVTVQHLVGTPDDRKLVSSLTLFAGVARRAGPEAPGPWVARAEAVLAAAGEEGLPPCEATRRFLAAAGPDAS